jgi:hypothetical protein
MPTAKAHNNATSMLEVPATKLVHIKNDFD